MFLVLFLIFQIIQVSLSWQLNNQFTTNIQGAVSQNLTSFLAYYSDSHQYLLVYGGQENGDLINSTQIIYNNGTSVQINNGTYPQGRKDYCWSASGSQLYIFAGVFSNGTASTQVWKFDLTLLAWEMKINDLSDYSFCETTYLSGNLFLLAKNSLNNLQILQYNPSSNTLTNKTLSFSQSKNITVTTYQNQSISYTIPIQNAQSINSTYVITSSTIDLSSITLLKVIKNQILSNTSSEFITNKGIYKMMMSGNQISIEFVSKILVDMDSFSAFENGDWRIFVGWKSQLLTLTFCYKSTEQVTSLNSAVSNFYSSWPTLTSGFSFWCYQNKTINIVIFQSLEVFSLKQNVYQGANTSNFLNSFYGMKVCQDGWLGSDCSINMTNCPNSLYLRDNLNLTVMSFECSGHGTCTNSGCNCIQPYEGTDCSTYNLILCQNSHLDNFPLVNCECINSTTGGNNCQVIFCPSDCTGHGQCVNGICNCNDLYYGADCSIMVVDFPTQE